MDFNFYHEIMILYLEFLVACNFDVVIRQGYYSFEFNVFQNHLIFFFLEKKIYDQTNHLFDINFYYPIQLIIALNY
jgi:hypothetical protein